ncbi:unnamed protein product [Rotaria sp. Silwood2]|nr:unnamed protein product [Rotaria sp. Silwood2]CAF4450776.1 unnamed protein product [Rotaria sp. Silwood2]
MALNNTEHNIDVEQVSKSIVNDLNLVTQRFVIYLPLIFLIFGFIGFIGNIFTYLQSELRSNTCCIYSLCGSIIDIINLSLNLFPNYLGAKYKIYIPWYISRITCKLSLFLLSFLPHLSINFLLMAIIDRFACTCKLTSPMYRLNQLKMVPWMIIITIISSCLASIYSPILYDLMYGFWCISTQPKLNSILYTILSGVMQPVIMLIFVLLTSRNVRQSHRRVGRVTVRQRKSLKNQFIVMIFAQVFVTGFLSLQWIMVYTYFSFTADYTRSYEQWSILFFVFSLTNNCYYLNNVKSFYLSILTSHLFRKTLMKGLIEILPRFIRPQFQVTQMQHSMATITRIRQRDVFK